MKNNISMKDFYEKYTNSSEKLTILDVREIHEYAAGHIPSAEAYDFLDAQGFDVINIEGGMNNWPGETK